MFEVQEALEQQKADFERKARPPPRPPLPERVGLQGGVSRFDAAVQASNDAGPSRATCAAGAVRAGRGGLQPLQDAL